jgi:hypothetical protein
MFGASQYTWIHAATNQLDLIDNCRYGEDVHPTWIKSKTIEPGPLFYRLSFLHAVYFGICIWANWLPSDSALNSHVVHVLPYITDARRQAYWIPNTVGFVGSSTAAGWRFSDILAGIDSIRKRPLMHWVKKQQLHLTGHGLDRSIHHFAKSRPP